MSGILFFFDVISFLIVAFWAYANDRSRSDISAKGLLGMRAGGEPSMDAAARKGPKWKRSQRAAVRSGRAAEAVRDLRSEPRWRRSFRRQGKA